MNKVKSFIAALLFVPAIFIFSGCLPDGSGTQAAGVVRSAGMAGRVDHILLMPDADKCKPLFDFFTTELNLPVAWPYKNYGDFSSGAAYFGNVSVEIIETCGPPRDGSKIAGVAFEPSAPSAIVAGWLDEKGIAHEEPAPFPPPAGGLWTSTYVKDIMPGSQIFFCEYHIMVPQTQRKRLGESFEAAGGGTLKLKSLKKIVIETKNLQACMTDWNRLLSPLAADNRNCVYFGSGPAISFVSGGSDSIKTLVVESQNLNITAAVMRGRGWLKEGGGPSLEFDPRKTAGVSIIVE